MPAYLITRDSQIRNSPDAARERLRADGFDTFEEAVKAAEGQGLVTVSAGTVTLATDAVCAMIGNTPELVPDTQDAWKAGYSELDAADGSALSVYYNRYVVTRFVQTDTILMIGSITGLLVRRQRHHQRVVAAEPALQPGNRRAVLRRGPGPHAVTTRTSRRSSAGSSTRTADHDRVLLHHHEDQRPDAA